MTECIIVSTLGFYRTVNILQELHPRYNIARNTDRLVNISERLENKMYSIKYHTAGTVKGWATFPQYLPGIDPMKIRLRLYHDWGTVSIFSKKMTISVSSPTLFFLPTAPLSTTPFPSSTMAFAHCVHPTTKSSIHAITVDDFLFAAATATTRRSGFFHTDK